MTNTDTTVANTILSQIGGNRALVMIGARGANAPSYTENGLFLKIARGISEITMVSIELNPADEYTVKFYKGRGLKLREVKSVEVQAAELRATIEQTAKVRLSL